MLSEVSSESNNAKSKKQPFIIILLTTGVVSVLITSIFTLVISYNTSRSLEKIESIKFNQQLVTFRYKKLLESWEKYAELSRIYIESPMLFEEDYIKSKVASIFSQTTFKMANLYLSSSPLFDSDLRKELDSSIDNYDKIVLSKIEELSEKNNKESTVKAMADIIDAITEFINIYQDNLNIQLERLLKPNTEY